MMKRKVAIFGLGDYPEPRMDFHGWERWATAQHDDLDCHRFYQIHTGALPDYLVNAVKELPAPVYGVQFMPEAQAWREYPLQDALDLTGGYLECSIAFMIAHAILEGVAEIYIARVGAPMDDHYAYQRACIEHLIGIARGRGIKVSWQPNCCLCKSFWDGGIYGKCRQ